MSPQIIDNGSSARLTANTFTRASHLFLGWATTPSGALTYIDEQLYTMGNSNVTLYAVWAPSSSVIVHYTFASQDCTDSSGNGNNGTSNNITYISNGIGGYSASFDGASSYIALPNSIGTTYSEFTIKMGFNVSSGQGGILFGYQNQPVGNSPGDYVPIISVQSNGYLRGELYMGSNFGVSSTNTVDDGQWHTVYFSATSSSVTLYLDGVVVGTHSGTVQSLDMIYNQIGTGDGAGRPYLPNSNGSNGWYYYDGLISDFLFLDVAL